MPRVARSHRGRGRAWGPRELKTASRERSWPPCITTTSISENDRLKTAAAPSRRAIARGRRDSSVNKFVPGGDVFGGRQARKPTSAGGVDHTPPDEERHVSCNHTLRQATDESVG